MINTEVYEHFAAWLDAQLENNKMPEDTMAYNFNLYEDRSEETGEKMYCIQLIASDRFDPDDEEGDWACYEVWSSEEDLFSLNFSDEGEVGYERVEEAFTELCAEYLEKGRSSGVLRSAKGIGIGFVDGDINIIYKASNKE